MYIFSVLYIFSSFLLIYGAAVLYMGNRKSTKHKAFALLFVIMAFWQQSALLITLVPPMEAAYVFVYALIPLLLGSFILMLHAVYLVTGVYSRKHSFLYKLLFLPPIINIALSPYEGWLYKGELIAYESQPPLGPGSFINFTTMLVYLIVMISLLIPQARKKHRPSQIWMIGVALFVLWVLVIVVFGELAKVGDSFSLVPLGIIFWAGAVYISVVKFDSLSSYEKRYNVLFEKAPIGIIIADRYSIIREASPRAAQHLGLPLNKLIGQSIFLHLNSEKREEKLAYYMNQFEQNNPMQQYEFSFQGDENGLKSLSVSSDFIEMEGDTYQLLMIENITESKRREEQIHQLAYFDQLTGLLNRVSFNMAFAEWKKNKTSFAFVLYDLNGFKQINDKYGHLAGDQALKHFAAKLKENTDSSHIVARLSGDEFAMLLNNVDDVERILNAIEVQLEKPTEISAGQWLSISASAGVSIYPDESNDYEVLFKLADDRMYRCKQAIRFKTN